MGGWLSFMDTVRVYQLSKEGFQCAQILMIHALEIEDSKNADLVRAAGGLNASFSNTAGPCGALTGGCCFLSYFSGKGDDTEIEDPAFKAMLSEFTHWFRAEYGSQICIEILGGDIKNMPVRCPGIILAVYAKTTKILEENDVI